MSASTKEITEKISSVKNIKKITKAMEMVAASKMKRATERALGVRSYGRAALNLLVNLSQERGIDHKFLHRGKGDKVLLIMISSNKGLCGGYNSSIYKKADKFIKENYLRKENLDFMAVGKYSERYALRRGFNIVGAWEDILDAKSISDIRSIANVALEEFESDKYRKVVFFYTRFMSALNQKPVYRTILPVRSPIAEQIIGEVDSKDKEEFERRDMNLYLFEPDEESVLSEIIPRLVEILLFEGLSESVASEHSARMVAMKNATDNAGTLVDDLTLSYNRARQASVTREISEISSGAEALKD